MELLPEEGRVLGALMEKARTTPDVYPLTLNSLVLACNQKTSRDPVTDYDEDIVEQSLDRLRELNLAMRVDMAGSRTPKFRENVSVKWELTREEYALLTVLLLRGAQTPGQLRQRCERLFPFAEVQQVTDWLGRMHHREEEPLVLVRSLGRKPGTKEIRYTHTLFGDVREESLPPTPVAQAASAGSHAADPPPAPQPDTRRVSELEARLEAVEARLAGLERLLNDLTS